MYLYNNCIAKVKNVVSFLEEIRQILSDFVKKNSNRREEKLEIMCIYIMFYNGKDRISYFGEKIVFFLL